MGAARGSSRGCADVGGRAERSRAARRAATGPAAPQATAFEEARRLLIVCAWPAGLARRADRSHGPRWTGSAKGLAWSSATRRPDQWSDGPLLKGSDAVLTGLSGFDPAVAGPGVERVGRPGRAAAASREGRRGRASARLGRRPPPLAHGASPEVPSSAARRSAKGMRRQRVVGDAPARRGRGGQAVGERRHRLDTRWVSASSACIATSSAGSARDRRGPERATAHPAGHGRRGPSRAAPPRSAREGRRARSLLPPRSSEGGDRLDRLVGSSSDRAGPPSGAGIDVGSDAEPGAACSEGACGASSRGPAGDGPDGSVRAVASRVIGVSGQKNSGSPGGGPAAGRGARGARRLGLGDAGEPEAGAAGGGPELHPPPRGAAERAADQRRCPRGRGSPRTKAALRAPASVRPRAQRGAAEHLGLQPPRGRRPSPSGG